MEVQVCQLGEHGGDGGFEGSVFAGDEAFCWHGAVAGGLGDAGEGSIEMSGLPVHRELPGVIHPHGALDGNMPNL
jgi:hypothetical protein